MSDDIMAASAQEGGATCFRSLLFVPGSRPERFEKAYSSGADAVCLDLEDSVSSNLKAEARKNVCDAISSIPDGMVVGVRVNGLETIDFHHDLVAIYDLHSAPDFILFPKIGGAKEVLPLARMWRQRNVSVWALIETPEGIANTAEIANAVGQDGGIIFGAVDYSGYVGCDMSFEALAYARGALCAGASTAGCQILDSPHVEISDLGGFREQTLRTKALGFSGRACIHPGQVPVANQVYTPTDEEIKNAQVIIDTYRAAAGEAVRLDGKMVEKPMLQSAYCVLARAAKMQA